MGGIVTKGEHYQLPSVGVPKLLKSGTASTAGLHASTSSIHLNAEKSVLHSVTATSLTGKSMQAIAERNSLQDFEHYSGHLIRNFQFSERSMSGDRSKKQYAEFLVKVFFSGLTNLTTNFPVSAVATVPSSPVSDVDLTEPIASNVPELPVNTDPSMIAAASSMREELDRLVMEVLSKKVPALEVFDTVFADYHIILSDEDAQSKVLALTQLKTRDVSSYRSDSDGLRNPLITIETLRDLFALALWPVYQELDKLGKFPGVISPISSPDASTSLFRKNSSFSPISRLTVRTQPENNEVTLFEPIEESGKQTPSSSRRLLSFKLKGISRPQVTLCKTRKPFETSPSTPTTPSSVKRNSFITPQENRSEVNAIVTPTGKPSRLDLERHISILALFDQMNSTISSTPDLTASLKASKWSQSTIFFSHLERISAAIAIVAVESDGSFFPFVYVNKAWEKITGHYRQNVIGQESRRFLAGPQSERAHLEKIDYAMEEGLALKVGITHRRQDSSHYFDFFSLHPVYDCKKQCRYLVMKFYDVMASTATLKQVKYAEEAATLVALAMRYL